MLDLTKMRADVCMNDNLPVIPTRPSWDVTIRSTDHAQLDLFGPEEVFYPEGATLAERFEIFHQANPGVFRALVRLAMERRRAGITRGRIKALFEILRDRHELETRGDDWKLNNSYTAFYARLMMDTVPELRGWFETRRQTAVEEAA